MNAQSELQSLMDSMPESAAQNPVVQGRLLVLLAKNLLELRAEIQMLAQHQAARKEEA